MQYVVAPPPVYTLTVSGRDERFPVNRVFCVGRNYAAHAREMGKDPEREAPFFFMKPASAVVDGTQAKTIPYPPHTRNFQHEVELVVAVGIGGTNIKVQDALKHVYGYAVGLDMTRRDLQLEARDKGRPWEFGKSFSRSAPIGAIHRAADIGHPASAAIAVTVDGAHRQSSDIKELIWSVAECVAYLSEYEQLEPGDVIMTGTPEGVGPVVSGNVLRASISGLGEFSVTVAAL